MTALVLLLLAQTPAPLDAGPAPIPIEPRVDDTEHADAGVAAAAAAVDGGAGAALDVTLTVATEPVVAVFGEPFQLVISIARDRGLRLELPGAIPDVTEMPRTAPPTRSVEELPGGRVRESIRIPYLALDVSDLKTPAFALTAPDGSTVDVPSLTVRVDVPPVDAGPAMTKEGAVVLAPAAPTIAYSVPDSRPWIALGSLAGAGVIVALVRLLAKRKRARPVVVKAPPPRPAHEIALERLDALLAAGLLARGETAPFVERLMDEVLRDYLEARFALHAGTRTTRELVKEMLGVSVPGLDVTLVESLLADADLVKFAKASIAADRAHAMSTRVRALIETTALRAAPQAPSSGGAR